MNYLGKRAGSPIFITTILAINLFASAALYADSHVIKVSSDPWEPWVLGSEGKQATGGLAVEVTRELFKRLNLDIEINIYPYERCIRQMKTGERDVLLMVKKTEEREKYMLFSDVALMESQSIYYSSERMDGFEWQTWQDLNKYTVGGVRGSNYGDFDTAAKKHGISTELVSTENQNIKKLLAGRVDLIILNQSTANYYMSQNPESRGKLKAAEKSISESKFHFALSKNGKATAHFSGINMALRDMKADGTLDKLLKFSD